MENSAVGGMSGGDGAVVEKFISDALEGDDLPEVNDDIVEEGRAAIAAFLKSATCYDLVPDSGKVVVFDENIPLRLAYYAMVEHGSNDDAVNDIGHLATPVWNLKKQQLSGIITVREIIQILKYGYRTNSISEIMDKHSIGSWWTLIRQLKTSPELAETFEQNDIPAAKAAALLAKAEAEDDKRKRGGPDGTEGEVEALFVTPDESLYNACRLLRFHSRRWLPVMDVPSQTCLGVVTHLVVLRYLVHQFREERRLFDQPIRALGIGSFSSGRKVVCAKLDTLLCDVIDMLVDNKISCVPIVDDEMHPIEVYSTTNATTPVAKSSIDMCMTMPVSHFLFTETATNGETSTERVNMHHKSEFHTCLASDTLHEIFVQFANTQVPRLIVVDENGVLEGIVSLSDLLPYFLDDAYENHTEQKPSERTVGSLEDTYMMSVASAEAPTIETTASSAKLRAGSWATKLIQAYATQATGTLRVFGYYSCEDNLS